MDDYSGAAQNRYEKRKEETREKIVDVAMNLFNKQGFDATTLEQIAREADIARKTLYNHFREKEAIVHEYIRRTIREQTPEMIELLKQLPDTRSRLIAALHKSLEWMHIELDKNIYESYFTYRMQKVVQALRELDQSLNSGLNTFLIQIIELGKETGEIRQDVPSISLAGHLENMYSTTAITWLTHPEFLSIDDGIDMIVDLFLKGAETRGE